MRKLLLIIFFWLACFSMSYSQGYNTGDTLPDFQYQGQFEKPYHLRDLRGSYVLINFWASWNDESRAIQLNMIDTYAKHKDKRFKDGRKFYVISISLDQERHLYELALKKDNVPWRSNLCDFAGWDSPIVTILKVNAIPSNYLIGPDGVVISVNLKADEVDNLLRSY